jgi:hypothetical protein
MLLPFTRSLGLLVWVAMAPLAWLSEVPCGRAEDAWLAAIVHGPGLAFLALECATGTDLVTWFRRERAVGLA